MEKVIRSEAELKALLPDGTPHPSAALAKALKVAKIDWRKQMLVVVGDGPFDLVVRMRADWIVKQGGGFRVHWSRIHPGVAMRVEKPSVFLQCALFPRVEGKATFQKSVVILP